MPTTYISSTISSDFPNPKANPHSYKGDDLPRGMNKPFPKQRRENRADWEPGEENDGHDNTVRRASMIFASTAAGDSIVAWRSVGVGRVEERVGCAADGSFGKVNRETIRSIMLCKITACIACVQRATLLPGTDPFSSPLYARIFPVDVGNHRAIRHAASLDKLDTAHGLICRHIMTMSLASAQGDIARAVLVYNEHRGAAHAGAGANGDPLVRGRGLEANVEGGG